MKLIALILGLVLEHTATRGLRLRELRWFDPFFDFGLARTKTWGRAAALLALLALLAVAIAPVVVLSVLLAGTSILWDLSYLVFAVLVLFLCLGPRDLASEVDDYCTALEGGDADAASRVLTELSESFHPRATEPEVVEDAVFAQATNRVFGVIFWFVILGPVGAWLFRTADLLRRRTAFEAVRDPRLATAALPSAESIHGVLAWIPARLAALGYALGGSFDDALAGWRGIEVAPGVPLHRRNLLVVAGVGRSAMTGALQQPANSAAAARNSLRLVMRTLFIWLTVIALMTLFGWAV
ncbi:MAG TPA: regulatory signaling modulator protein AmpE [Gammaproteobacteria bacterium]|nr:regulatory signaling modulator protein AmpE [Gammaproteobacteria bacterium]